MRTFVALFPPQEILDSFIHIQERLSQYKRYIRLTDPPLIHLTIRFLGDNVPLKVMQEFIKEIKVALQETTAFNLRLQEIRYGFPGKRWPRILYVSAVENVALSSLKTKIEQVIEKNKNAEYFQKVETRDEIFHFTLARSNQNLHTEVIRQIRNELKKVELWEGFRVSYIHIVESILQTEGPKYIVKSKILL